MSPKKILVVAQTPPPVHGQALMMQYLLEGSYSKIELNHVRMAFSDDIKSIGVFGWKKVLHLLALIPRIWLARFQTGSTVLFYPPSGPNMVPFLRDVVLLISVRWLFKNTVFVFEAAGISGMYPRLSPPLKLLFRLAYNKPDLAITLSRSAPDDAAFIHSKTTVVIPNGIPDEAGSGPQAPSSMPPRKNRTPALLFLAMLSEEKGVLVLLEACALLKNKGLVFVCHLAGRAESGAFEKIINREIHRLNLKDQVVLHGLVQGDAKRSLFREADIFCFPSFYPSEAFPLVLLEAMQFSLPVVSTLWRGIPDIVVDGKTGFLVAAKEPQKTADKIETLLLNPAGRLEMGKAGRQRYEQEYTVEIFRERMENYLKEIRIP